MWFHIPQWEIIGAAAAKSSRGQLPNTMWPLYVVNFCHNILHHEITNPASRIQALCSHSAICMFVTFVTPYIFSII